jgi:hypothetical protein
MKTVKIVYWIFTILLVLLMLSSVIGSFMPNNPQGEAFAKHLGYSMAILRFLAVAKLLGIIAILVPGYPRLKEWAYAGLAFDLIGAAFSGLAVGDPIMQWMFVYFGIVLVFGSYIFYHKKQKVVI